MRQRFPSTRQTQPISWLAVTTDDRDLSVSTMIEELRPMELGFTQAQRRDRLLAEDFEDAQTQRRWQLPLRSEVQRSQSLGVRRGGPWRQAGASASAARWTVCCEGMRGQMFRNSGSQGISFWLRSPGDTGLQVQWMFETADGTRHYWSAAVPSPGTAMARSPPEVGRVPLPRAIRRPHRCSRPAWPQLRFTTPEKAKIHIDDVNTLRE